jgi:hypothetical protein
VSVVRREAYRRWSLVGVGVVLLGLVPPVLSLRQAPEIRVDPLALRGRILASTTRQFSGNIDSQGGLGLPELPELGDLAGLLGGAANLRIWYAGPDAWRVAQLQGAGERDVYRSTTGTYLWDFQSNLLTRVVGTPPVRMPWAADLSPPDLARRLLGEQAPGDRLSALPGMRVAGVVAAGVRLTPADPATTIDRVDIWADPRTGLPLRIEVHARASGRPVFMSRFLDLAQRAPDRAAVVPHRAAGAGFTVTNQPDIASVVNSVAAVRLPGSLAGQPRVRAPGGVAAVAAYGGGLSRFVVIPLPGRAGCQSMRTLSEANAQPATLSDGRGYRVVSPAVTTLVVRAVSGDHDADDPVFLLAGLVSPALLDQAATQLLGMERR